MEVRPLAKRYLGSDLVPALAGLDMHDLTHGCECALRFELPHPLSTFRTAALRAEPQQLATGRASPAALFILGLAWLRPLHSQRAPARLSLPSRNWAGLRESREFICLFFFCKTWKKIRRPTLTCPHRRKRAGKRRPEPAQQEDYPLGTTRDANYIFQRDQAAGGLSSPIHSSSLASA